MSISTVLSKTIKPAFRRSPLALVALGVALGPSIGLAAKDDLPNGKPFQQIEEQLADLNQQLDALTGIVDDQLASTMPVVEAVNCAAGESVSAVLSQYENATAPLTINIEGVCNEVVGILRSNVTLNGATAGATIHSDHNVFGSVSVSRSVGNVSLTNLTLSGGIGLLASRSSHTFLNNVDITQTNNGIIAVDNASVTLENSRIFGNSLGVVATRLGSVSVVNSVVENNTAGVFASVGGVVSLATLSSSGETGVESIVSNNNIGVLATSGARITMEGSRIEGNSFLGVRLQTQSSIRVSSNSLISAHQIGIQAEANTSVELNGPSAQITNNVIGVRCLVDTANLATSGGANPSSIVINNAAVDIDGCATVTPGF